MFLVLVAFAMLWHLLALVVGWTGRAHSPWYLGITFIFVGVIVSTDIDREAIVGIPLAVMAWVCLLREYSSPGNAVSPGDHQSQGDIGLGKKFSRSVRVQND